MEEHTGKFRRKNGTNQPTLTHRPKMFYREHNPSTFMHFSTMIIISIIIIIIIAAVVVIFCCCWKQFLMNLILLHSSPF